MIAALNKYWRPLTEKEYWENMDIISTNNAIAAANFPKEIEDWIFETKKPKFGFVAGKVQRIYGKL